MGVGLSREASGCRRRILLFGLSAQSRIRRQRFIARLGSRRFASCVSENHGIDCGERCGIGSSGFIAVVQTIVSYGGCRLFGESEKRLAILGKRVGEIRTRRCLSKNYALRK